MVIKVKNNDNSDSLLALESEWTQTSLGTELGNNEILSVGTYPFRL